MNTRAQLIESYEQFLTQQGRRPASVKAFVDGLEDTSLTQVAFFKEFNSFEAIEAAIFGAYFDVVATALKDDPTYQTYPAAQRLAAIYFTWIERLGQSRSLLLVMRDAEQSWGFPSFIDGAKAGFQQLVGELIREGIDEEQIADRFFITQFYPQVLWNQARFLIQFWLYDNSPSFQRTDASVEKITRFTFDLLGPNLVDSGWDLLRFITRR